MVGPPTKSGPWKLHLVLPVATQVHPPSVKEKSDFSTSSCATATAGAHFGARASPTTRYLKKVNSCWPPRMRTSLHLKPTVNLRPRIGCAGEARVRSAVASLHGRLTLHRA